MEQIDLLAADGVKTGHTKSKQDVHTDGDWHKAVHVWILNSSNELLIQRRSPRKESNPNMWDVSVGGHVSAGEESHTSALREVEEEIGVKLSKEDLQYLFTIVEQSVLNNGTYIDNEFQNVYLVKADISVSDIALQEEEVAEVKFVTVAEFKKDIEAKRDVFVSHWEEYKKLLGVLQDK